MSRSFRFKILLKLLAIQTSLLGQAQNWIQIEDFPGTARDDGVSFVLGEVAYFGTGLQVGWTPTSDFYAYQIGESWSEIAPMPAGSERQYACACSDNSYGYVFGGQGEGNEYLNDLWRYDPEVDIWMEMTALPAAGRSGMACFSFGEELYFVGGRTGEDQHTSETWRYSPDSDSWEQLPDHPGGAIWRLQSAVMGDPGNQIAFLSTGLTETNTYYSDVHTFSEASQNWNGPVSNLPSGGLMYSAMASYQNGVCVFAGQNENATFLNDLQVWLPENEFWENAEPLPSFERRGGMMASLNGEVIYVAGLNPDFERIKEVWATFLETDVHSDFKKETFTIYPNPGKDEVRIAGFKNQVLTTRVRDLNGRQYLQEKIHATEILELGFLDSGVYIISLADEKGNIFHKVWIKAGYSSGFK
jgi:N-acetylneuraminic acid mutarotase